MRLFKDGRGLLRRVRWVRVIVVTAAVGVGVGVSWARRGVDEAAALGALKTIPSHSCMHREVDRDLGAIDYGDLEALSNTTLIASVGLGGTKQGYLFVEQRPLPATPAPIGK